MQESQRDSVVDFAARRLGLPTEFWNRNISWLQEFLSVAVALTDNLRVWFLKSIEGGRDVFQ